MTQKASQAKKTKDTADMLCTAHALLRDRFRFYATVLDVFIFLLAAYLVSLTFAPDRVRVYLNVSTIDPDIWVGLISLGVFALSIFQLLVDWKGKSESHSKSFSLYAEVKKEISDLLSKESLNDDEYRRIASKYDMATEIGTNIPESQFLRLKKAHKLKVEISKHLDNYPGASILLTRLKLFWRDTISRDGAER